MRFQSMHIIFEEIDQRTFFFIEVAFFRFFSSGRLKLDIFLKLGTRTFSSRLGKH